MPDLQPIPINSVEEDWSAAKPGLMRAMNYVIKDIYEWIGSLQGFGTYQVSFTEHSHTSAAQGGDYPWADFVAADVTWVQAGRLASSWTGGDLFITAGTVSCSDLTDGYVPYHVSDAVGLANSIIQVSATTVTIGTGAAGVDYILKFDGENNDGIITWMEDEDYFKFGDNVLLDAGSLYLTEIAAAQADIAAKGQVWVKNDTPNTLWFTDDAGTDVQLGAAAPAGSIPAGTKMLFYANTAPTGWTIDNTLDDKMVFVTKGSVAGGETGGGAHSTGTWTQPNHSHTIPSLYLAKGGALGYAVSNSVFTADSTWNLFTSSGAGGGTCYAAYSYTDTGTSGNGATANTWRPASYCFIVCSKN